MKDLLNQTITLDEGRVLGYAETGDVKGIPLFLFHGLNIPMSRPGGNYLER